MFYYVHALFFIVDAFDQQRVCSSNSEHNLSEFIVAKKGLLPLHNPYGDHIGMFAGSHLICPYVVLIVG